MTGLPNEERRRLGALLDHTSQEEVMAKIPQFSQAEVHSLVPPPAPAPEALGALVFNMERGVCLEELGDFLESCPAVQPFDVILANELDDGCVRSGGKDTTLELAKRLGMNAVFGLEFIELVNGADPKGFHGNAIFSRWPIKRAKAVRLPEQYNWYFDRQRRIGGWPSWRSWTWRGSPWAWGPSTWRTGPTARAAGPSWRPCWRRPRPCSPACPSSWAGI